MLFPPRKSVVQLAELLVASFVNLNAVMRLWRKRSGVLSDQRRTLRY